MNMLLVTFFFMLFVVTIMAIGVIIGRKPIAGSCGGMSALGMETECDICGGDQSKCDEENERVASLNSKADLGYDASQTNK